MKKTIWLLFLLICTLNNYSQNNYTVSCGSSSYDTLTTYTSILYELLPEPYMSNDEVDVNFEFSFPFFDSNFNSVTIDSDGVGYFPGSDSVYNLSLFTGEFTNHVFSPIFSDWRYTYDTTGILDILKVEWRNIGIADDIEGPAPTDHRINFQWWFYENGVIEIHFGEIDLANTPYYSETDGFIWDNGESYGPWIGIANNNESEVYFVSGTNSDINVITNSDSIDIFYDIPPYGNYFRFTPDEVTSIHSVEMTNSADYIIFPNPVKDVFSVKLKDKNNTSVFKTELKIYSSTGELVKSKLITNSDDLINISALPSGIYFVRLISEKFQSAPMKLVKQ